MTNRLRRWLLPILATLALAIPAAAQARKPGLLVFSRTTGYRHASIEAGIAAIRAIGARRGFEVVASEDPDIFSTDGLRRFDAIVLLSNTTRPADPASEYWTDARRAAFQAFVHRGGGIVAIHAAADSHYGWPWYGRLIGGRFARHPKGTPSGTVRIADAGDPTARGMAGTAQRTDEWYYFDDYDPTAHLIATLDPQSIGAADVNPNPMSWRHSFEGARVFYTAMGHTDASFAEPWFLRHLENGIAWVVKR